MSCHSDSLNNSRAGQPAWHRCWTLGPADREVLDHDDAETAGPHAPYRVEARTEDQQDDVEEENRVSNQEPWRVLTKNGLTHNYLTENFHMSDRETLKAIIFSAVLLLIK